ncbi:MAG: indole-3-glycerol phosphate synthase TrpC, partial [Clostridiales Family XIII bacterium]|nr:indole-3-glycerol phosphate synthase TrpC [Clostridiales Family XIII bacterium]
MTILDTLADTARIRVAEAKSKVSLDEIKAQALRTIALKQTLSDLIQPPSAILQELQPSQSVENVTQIGNAVSASHFAFYDSLYNHSKRGKLGSKLSFICEVKKASPSKGIISEDFDYLKIAKEYEQAGAAAISVLTEPSKFLGSDDYLRDISHAVDTPIIRKDFTVDAYQIYEAKVLGASAVLLICAILDEQTIKDFIEIATTLKLDCLVEAHDEAEVRIALAAGAQIVGVN